MDEFSDIKRSDYRKVKEVLAGQTASTIRSWKTSRVGNLCRESGGSSSSRASSASSSSSSKLSVYENKVDAASYSSFMSSMRRMEEDLKSTGQLNIKLCSIYAGGKKIDKITSMNPSTYRKLKYALDGKSVFIIRGWKSSYVKSRCKRSGKKAE